MALHRGIQSAIFFYLSCAPCAEIRVRKKRRQQAERDRASRMELEAHMPGLYQHPEPSSTNPYWQTEIDAGPIPSRTRKKVAAAADKMARANSTRSNIASSVSIDASMSMERSDSALSGLGPYQRNDDVLWGSRASDISRPRTSKTTSSRDVLPTRPSRAALRDGSRSYHQQNAAVNDLHPPTTRRIESKEEVMWMMQPPPVPEVMNGKTTRQDTRSNSITSRPSVSTRGKDTSRPCSQKTPGSPDIAPVDPRPHSASKYLEVPTKLTRSRTLPVRHLSFELAQGGHHSVVRKPPPSLQLSQNRSRPTLSTILSETATRGVPGYENDLPHRSASFGDRIDSAAGTRVRELRPGGTLVARKQQSPTLVETRMFVPAQDLADEHEHEPTDALECWTSPDFELPQWIHDHTKREVRERWSFDI